MGHLGIKVVMWQLCPVPPSYLQHKTNNNTSRIKAVLRGKFFLQRIYYIEALILGTCMVFVSIVKLSVPLSPCPALGKGLRVIFWSDFLTQIVHFTLN